MSNERDDVSKRLGARFDDEPEDQQNEQSETSNAPTPTDKNEQNENRSKNAKNSGKDGNVKKDWIARSVYLPDDLNRKTATGFKRLDLQVEEKFSESIKKTRHFYPLIFQLGLEQMEQMEVKELKERMEQWGR